MVLPLLPLVLLLLGLGGVDHARAAGAAQAGCLRHADYDTINQLFSDGGPGTVVQLCPGRVYRLSGTITFTDANQELSTYGYPSGSERALLRVEGTDVTAIQGDCRRCGSVSIKNVIVDGNRRKRGRAREDQDAGLIVLGGNEGQSVSNSAIRDPRGFTGIHFREGDRKQCRSATIEGNEIGPVGEEYDPARDGPDPEGSELGRPLADGLSIACKDSIVRDNYFVDNTGAAVVLYCSPGTAVSGNRIVTDKKSVLAGVLMVDSSPWDGDYTGTVVKNNIIESGDRLLRIGIGAGAAVFSDDIQTILTGGSIVGNTLRGKNLGFGIAATGLKGWTITDNLNEGEYTGMKSERCFTDPPVPRPRAFMYHAKAVADSKVQAEFENRDFQYIACIDEIPRQRYEEAPPAAQKPMGQKGQQGGKGPAREGKPQRGADKGKAARPAKQQQQQQQQQKQQAGEAKGKPNPKVAAAGGGAAKGAAAGAGGAGGSGAQDKAGAQRPAKGIVNKGQFDTGSKVVDNVLELSRQRMLEAIAGLGDTAAGKVAPGAAKGGAAKHGHGAKGAGVVPPAGTSIQDVKARMDALEAEQAAVLELAAGLRRRMSNWEQQMANSQTREQETLASIRALIARARAPASAKESRSTPDAEGGAPLDTAGEGTFWAAIQAGLSEQEREALGLASGQSNRERLMGHAFQPAGGVAGAWSTLLGLLGSLVKLGAVGGIVVMACMGVSRMRRARNRVRKTA